MLKVWIMKLTCGDQLQRRSSTWWCYAKSPAYTWFQLSLHIIANKKWLLIDETFSIWWFAENQRSIWRTTVFMLGQWFSDAFHSFIIISLYNEMLLWYYTFLFLQKRLPLGTTTRVRSVVQGHVWSSNIRFECD